MAVTLENRKQKPEAGFALLIAVIFMSVMLSFGLTLSSLAFKQQVLASSATESQYAFYAADAGLECALYADQGKNQNLFAYTSHDPPWIPGTLACGDASATIGSGPGPNSYNASQWVSNTRLSLDSNKRCADVTVYKLVSGATFIFSQGYDVSCATVGQAGTRYVTRGLSARY